MGSTAESLALKRNLSCSDKVRLTSSSGFSSNLAVPGLPWGISSMPPIETPRATQPILYSNDGTHCCLIGCKEAEVSLPRSKIEQRRRGERALSPHESGATKTPYSVKALFISVWQAGVHDGDITPATTNAWPASGPLYPISSTSLDSGWSLMNGLARGVSVCLVGLSPNRLHLRVADQYQPLFNQPLLTPPPPTHHWEPHHRLAEIVAEAGSAVLGLGVGKWAEDFANSFSLTALSVHHGVVSCQSKDGGEGDLPAGARGRCLDS
ncbi:hypothetical protein Q8A73_001509 [Channa argus]|nr:hypothetical protein Q8A73_001509 [Channa argus]